MKADDVRNAEDRECMSGGVIYFEMLSTASSQHAILLFRRSCVKNLALLAQNKPT